jgi:hypothetical protein
MRPRNSDRHTRFFERQLEFLAPFAYSTPEYRLPATHVGIPSRFRNICCDLDNINSQSRSFLWRRPETVSLGMNENS